MDRLRRFCFETIKRKVNFRTLTNALMLCFNLCCHASIDSSKDSSLGAIVVCKSSSLESAKDEVTQSIAIRNKANSAKRYFLNFVNEYIFMIYATFHHLLYIRPSLKNILLIEDGFMNKFYNMHSIQCRFDCSVKLLS